MRDVQHLKNLIVCGRARTPSEGEKGFNNNRLKLEPEDGMESTKVLHVGCQSAMGSSR